MLNADRLLTLADEIEKMHKGNWNFDVPGFDMKTWNEVLYKTDETTGRRTKCGTVGCIGGMAECLWPTVGPAEYASAFAILGDEGDREDYTTLHHLFHPNRADAWEASGLQAARVIRHLVKTGEVDWSDDVMNDIGLSYETEQARLADDGNPNYYDGL